MVRYGRLAVLVVIYAVIAYLIPPPSGVTPEGWRLTAIFVAVIAGQMLQPMSSPAIVLIGLAAMVANGTTMAEALGGYAAPSVWLVLVAMIMARVLIDTGAAHRIALLFIRQFGKRSLGVSYALVMTDVTLAGGVPSITARSAGMVMPVGRAIAELFDSNPGPTAPRLGRFLFASMYQGSAVACAMFLTGQASNILGAGLAMKLVNVEITWSNWFISAIVPGIVSCIAVPWVVYKIVPPEIVATPQATEFARAQLEKLGAVGRKESIALGVFASVGLLWLTSGLHGLDVTFVSILGLATLLLTRVLAWDQVTGERSAWDVFIWYGGLLKMGELLNNTGVTRVFAESVGGIFVGLPWFTVLLLTLLIYFYAHYFFASITAHVLAMFPPFVLLLTAVGVPPLLAVYSLMCLANLTAGLTHYGTTTGPILYSANYVTFGEWWRAGFAVSVVNLVVWLTVGFAWWKWLGYW
ncbi:MAG TPA: DASS family sodium-coupled anion symporter [Vicinamibacterales bacterium]|nr:DASS family sodium-coupled anion symporter [Vicinamibacterales bacterium]